MNKILFVVNFIGWVSPSVLFTQSVKHELLEKMIDYMERTEEFTPPEIIKAKKNSMSCKMIELCKRTYNMEDRIWKCGVIRLKEIQF